MVATPVAGLPNLIMPNIQVPDGGPQPYLLDGLGLWAERRTETSFAGQPALFLDRDGVVVEECHYLGRAADMVMMPGIAAAIAQVNAAGVAVILVTNQAGIARSLYDWNGFSDVQNAVVDALARSGAHLDLVLACAYHGDGRPPFAVTDHPWRKPQPGMIDYGASLLAVDRGRSHIVGDRLSDLKAARAARIGGGTLVLTGHGTGDVDMTRQWLAEPAAKGFGGEISDQAPAAIERWLQRLGAKKLNVE